MKMTTEEAFIKVLQRHGIEHAFGIIGSAMMPVSDLFPAAGIKFWDFAHECNAGMAADGYTRASGMMTMCIAQNGPGITNLVTPIMTAYRQQALGCALALASGPMRVREVRSSVPDAGKILLSNVYGWFERQDRGVYGLTQAGREALQRWPQQDTPATDTVTG